MAKKPRKEDDDGLSDEARALQQAAPYLDAVSKLTAGVVAGFGAGYLLSRWLGKPWWMLVGAVVGIAAGFYGFISSIIQLGKKK